MKYLIRFTPLCPYFFGGEQTLGEGDKDVVNYFAKSNFMPQLSTVLGTIRFRLLDDNGLLDYSKEKTEDVERLIGKQGFAFPSDIARLSERQNYGCIKQISPVFISYDSEYYTRMPLNQNMYCEKINVAAYYSGICKNILYNFPNFNRKTYTNNKLWVNKKGNSLTDKLGGDIYTIKQQIGIIKEKSSEDNDDDAFFKQSLINLNPKLSFCCLVELQDNKCISEGSTIVFMGANRSAFKMEVSEDYSGVDFISSDNSNYFYSLKKSSNYKILLSDTFVTEKLKSEADFIWGQAINFKCIVNKVSNMHSWAKPNKSSLYHLLPAGSVIYGKSNLIESELKQPMLQQVGFNIFI